MEAQVNHFAAVGFEIHLYIDPAGGFAGVYGLLAHTIFRHGFVGIRVAALGCLYLAITIQVTRAPGEAGNGPGALMAFARGHNTLGVRWTIFVLGHKALIVAITGLGFDIQIVPVGLNLKPAVKAQFQRLVRVH